MEYQQGRWGRTYLIKMEHGEPLLENLRQFLAEQNIGQAVFWMLGALEKGRYVGGPQDCSVPPQPMPFSFGDGREILAFGTSFPDENGDAFLHIHGMYARGQETLAGCLRDQAQVYLVVEIFLAELLDFDVRRIPDPALQVRAIHFAKP